jgi:predicted Zn-dependent protease
MLGPMLRHAKPMVGAGAGAGVGAAAESVALAVLAALAAMAANTQNIIQRSETGESIVREVRIPTPKLFDAGRAI